MIVTLYCHCIVTILSKCCDCFIIIIGYVTDLVAELGVDLRGQALGHPVVVLAEVGVVLFRGVLLLPQVRHFDWCVRLKLMLKELVYPK